jgi:hypothetical protein
MSQSDTGPRRIVVPVAPEDVTITLDDILDALTQQAGSMAGAGQPPQLAPAVGDRLQRLGQLAVEMKSVLGELATVDPTVHAQLQGQGDVGQH